MVAATLTVAHAILLEAYISFLGYGIQPEARYLSVFHLGRSCRGNRGAAA